MRKDIKTWRNKLQFMKCVVYFPLFLLLPKFVEEAKTPVKFRQLYIIRPADLEEVTFLLPYTSVAECRAATSIISMGYAQAPHYVWGNRNRISPRCCPTIDKTLTINMGQKVYSSRNLLSHSDRLNELDSASIFSFIIIQIASLTFIDRVAFFDEGINAFAVIGTIENL